MVDTMDGVKGYQEKYRVPGLVIIGVFVVGFAA